MSRGNARNDDISWVEQYLQNDEIYNFRYQINNTWRFRYLGYSSTGNSIKFINLSTKQFHNYPLGGPREIWKRVLLDN